MKILLLPTALSLITVQAQDPLSFQDPDISGKWYINAMVPEMGPQVAQVFPVLLSVLSSGDVRASSVYMVSGQCREVDVILEKTDVPGRYRASRGRTHLWVEQTPLKDYLMTYCEGQLGRKRFRTAKLLSRHRDVTPEGLEAFKTFTQRKGLPHKDIYLPVQTEKCIPTPSHRD